MKRNIIAIMMVMVALLATQCKKSAEPLANEPAGETMEVTVRVENNTAKTDITATGVVTWKQGDKLYVVGETQGLLGYVSAVADDDPVQFEGEITALTSAQVLRFYYVGDKDFTLDGSGNYTFNLSSQDGTLEGIAAHSQLMFGKTTSTIAVGTANFGTITMTSQMAIAHLDITGNTSNTVTVKGGFATSTFNAKTYDDATPLTGATGTITMTSASAIGECYLALLPGTQTLKFSADGKVATLAAKAIAANKFYNEDNAVEVAVTTPTYEYVDLGLSVNWATCNVGATSPWDYGDYFAWGETETKDNYSWSTYRWCNGSESTITKYCTDPMYGTVDNKTVLVSADDAAHVVCGGYWRMPKQADFKELIDNTSQTWKDAGASIEIGGQTVSMPVAGCYCVSKKSGYTGKYIFLPAAGYCSDSSLNSAGSLGSYWSSSLGTNNSNNGRNLYFAQTYFYEGNRIRCYGYTVRPVCPR